VLLVEIISMVLPAYLLFVSGRRDGLLYASRRTASWLAEAGGKLTTRWRPGIPSRCAHVYV